MISGAFKEPTSVPGQSLTLGEFGRQTDHTKGPFVDRASFIESSLHGANKEWAAGYDALCGAEGWGDCCVKQESDPG